MATDQNKEVVRRFINEVLIGGHLDRIDEVLAPGYVNRAFGVEPTGAGGGPERLDRVPNAVIEWSPADRA